MHRLATFADSLAQGKGEGQGEEVRGGHREWCRASADPTLPYHSQGSQRTSKMAWCTRSCLFCTCNSTDSTRSRSEYSICVPWTMLSDAGGAACGVHPT